MTGSGYLADDLPPQPPREPSLEECCGSGCTPCVFDRYADALERYQEALRAWRARHSKALSEEAPNERESDI